MVFGVSSKLSKNQAKKADLSQAKGNLAATNKLSPHGIATALGALHSILVLLRAAEEVLHALARAAPDKVLEDGQVVCSLLVGVASLDELAADFVGHALQLGKGNLGLGAASIADGASAADRLGIVRGQHDACVGELAGAFESSAPLSRQDAGRDAVVARVGVLLCVEEAVARVRVDVRAADELDAQSKVAVARFSEVARENGRAGLLVRLVGAVDGGGLGLGVVLAGEFHGPAVDAVLQSVLLGVKEETHAALLGEAADGVDGLVQVWRRGNVLGQAVQSEAAGAGELESDKVTWLSEGDGLKRAVGPGLDLGGNVLGSLLALVLGGYCAGLVLAEDYLFGIAENDAGEANVLQAGDGAADLGGVFAGAELCVKCLFEEEAQQRVGVCVEKRVGGVGEDGHDAQRGR